MRLHQLFEDFNFVNDIQAKSFIDLMLKALMGSSRAITKYLDTSPEQLQSLQRSVGQGIRAKNRDILGDLNDIVDLLVADGHVQSIEDVRLVTTFFKVVDQVIRSKRETN